MPLHAHQPAGSADTQLSSRTGWVRSAAQVLLVAALAAVVPASHAQAPNEWANCQEVTDPDVMDRMELCAAHAGCKLVLKVHKTCTAVRSFADRLGQSIGQGVKTLFGYRKEIQPDNLWEALQTDNTRQLDELPVVKETATRIRDGLGSAKTEIQTGTNSRGLEYAILGPKAEPGAAERWAMSLDASGEIQRGQYLNGRLHMGDVIRLSESGEASRVVGSFSNGSLIGRGAQVNTAGTVSDGLYNQGSLTQGTRRYKTGEREEGSFDKVGNTTELIQGSKYGRDGSLVERGVFRGGQLHAGERYANGQVVATVDGDRELRERAQARQAAELQRQGEEKARRDAEAARREREFQQDLQRMNAGELYALADQLREQREADKARQTLRALVARFPNHPLASAAASEMVPDRPAPVAAVASSHTASRSASGTGPSPAAPRTVSMDEARRQCMPPAASIRQASELTCEGYRMIAPDHPATIRQSEECHQNLRRMGDAELLKSYEVYVNPQQLQAHSTRENYRGAQASKWFGPARRLQMEAAVCTEKLVNGGAGNAQPVSPVVRTPGDAVARSSTGAGRVFGPAQGDACRGEPLRNPQYEAALAALPQNSPSVLIRGALMGIDMQLDAYRQCPRTPEVSQMIQALENQRSQALTTCRQIVATDNCLVSPF